MVPMILTLTSDDFFALAGEILSRGERLRFRATGTSMTPFIRSGDVLVASPANGVRTGDVVLYRSAEGPRAHRVTGREEGGFRVQGDAPGCLPEEVAGADVLGRVEAVERDGRVIRMDRGPQRLMGWPAAGIPGGRRLVRTMGGWGAVWRGRRDREAEDLRRVVRLCCCAKAPRGLSDEDWSRLTAVAEACDLAPMLHLRAKEEALPPEAASALKRAYYVAAARHAVLSASLGTALRALKTAKIETMVLKGAALAETVYPSPACRPMTDVDLLVRPEDLRAADRALAGLGYRAVDGRAEAIDPDLPASLSTLEYQAEDPIAPPIHLHWHLVNTSVPVEAYRDRIDLGEVWAEALPFRVAGAETLRMASHHLIVYLCEHALRPAHAFYKPAHVTDLARVIAGGLETADWARVADVARRFGLDRMVYLGLLIVRDRADAPVPDEVLRALRPTRLTAGERLFLRRALRGRSRPGDSYFVHLAMRRTFFEKARFLFRTIFPAREVASHHASGNLWRGSLRRGVQAVRHAMGI